MPICARWSISCLNIFACSSGIMVQLFTFGENFYGHLPMKSVKARSSVFNPCYHFMQVKNFQNFYIFQICIHQLDCKRRTSHVSFSKSTGKITYVSLKPSYTVFYSTNADQIVIFTSNRYTKELYTFSPAYLISYILSLQFSIHHHPQKNSSKHYRKYALPK